MRHSLLFPLLPFLLAMTITVDGSFETTGSLVLAEASSAPASVTFADSDWGTAGDNDLSSRIPRPVPLESYLPVSTAGWTTTTIACAISGGSNPEDSLAQCVNQADASDAGFICQFPTNCQMTATTTNGTAFAVIGVTNDNLIIRGNADGLSEMIVDPADPDGANWDTLGITIGSANPTPITSWVWSGGFAQGDQVITATSLSDLYDGDIIQLVMDTWSGESTSKDPEDSYRVLCARWSDTNHGSDCTGVSSNGDIRLDRELPMDYTGASYFFGSIANKTIRHLERKGGGTTTDNIPENIGIENLTIRHAKPGHVQKNFAAIEHYSCMECWVTGSLLGPWGNSVINVGNGGQMALGRLMIQGNGITGPFWAADDCAYQVTSITAADPIVLNMTAGAGQACPNIANPGAEHTLFFAHDFGGCDGADNVPECALADRYWTVDDCGGSYDCVGPTVSVTVIDPTDGSSVDGTGMTATSGGVTLINNWNIAAIYISGPNSETQIVNNWFHNVRVPLIYQADTSQFVYFANYETTDTDAAWSRGSFSHGSSHMGLVERNESSIGFTTVATATQGSGVGPYYTLLYNRGIPHGNTTTDYAGSQCGGGGGFICNERTSLEGASSDQHNYLGNFLMGYSNGEGCGIDDLDHNDSDPGGVEEPYQLYQPAILNNILVSAASGNTFVCTTPNPSTISSDTGTDATDGYDVDSAPTAWMPANFTYPTSAFYDRTIEGDSGWTNPDWWCTQSGPFHNGMGTPADDYNAGSPSYSKLPAQIRHESGTCTTP